jgi:hypothetical protein
MTTHRFPPPWRAEPIPGGYVVRDAKGQAIQLCSEFAIVLVAMRKAIARTSAEL